MKIAARPLQYTKHVCKHKYKYLVEFMLRFNAHNFLHEYVESK